MAPDWMTANNAVSIAPPEPPYTDSPWDRIRRGIGTVLMHRAGPAAGILGALLAAPRTPSDVYQEGQQRWQDAYRRRLGEAQLGNFKGMQESRNLQDKARLLGLQGSLPLGTSPDDAQKALGVEPMTTEARGGTFVAQPQGYLNADTGRISGGFRNIFTPSGETTKMLMRPQPTESEELKRAYWTSRMQPKPAEQETPLQKAQRERTEAQTEAIRGGKPAKPISEWTQEQETELQSDKTPEQRKNILREFKTYLVGKHHGGTGQPKMTLKDRIGALTAEIQEKENNIEEKKAQPNAQEYVNQLKQIRSALIMEGATGNLNAKPITAPITAPMTAPELKLGTQKTPGVISAPGGATARVVGDTAAQPSIPPNPTAGMKFNFAGTPRPAQAQPVTPGTARPSWLNTAASIGRNLADRTGVTGMVGELSNQFSGLKNIPAQNRLMILEQQLNRLPQGSQEYNVVLAQIASLKQQLGITR